MTPLTIRNASEVYGDASRCEIVRHWVDHPELEQLSRDIRSMVHELGDESQDEFWRRTLGPIRRTAFLLCSTPLPFSSLSNVTPIHWSNLDHLVRQCRQQYPDFSERLLGISNSLKSILLETSTPLLKPIEELFKENGGPLAVVLRNPRMNRVLADFFGQSRTLRRAKIVSPSQLRGTHLSSTLIAIGPCGWFPEYVFSAPRVASIHIVSYRWIRDGWKPRPLFLIELASEGNSDGSHRIGPVPQIRDEFVPIRSEKEELPPVELHPPLPRLTRELAPRSFVQEGSTDDGISARLCHLSGNRAVFVSAEEGSSSLIIDTSEMGHPTVHRVPVEQLEHGMHLLLRTSGGGDFIGPLADKILGAEATDRRLQQAAWKERVSRCAVERFGHLGRRELSVLVASELQSEGHIHIRPANVHYWMSAKSIRPRKIEDYAAILTFAGLEAQLDKLWSAMGEIDRSHRKAGHLIRRMLLEKIADVSLDPLERDGEMDFELGDQDGGSLSAFLISEVSSQEYEVAADRIGVLLDLEDD